MKRILCYGDSNTWGAIPGTSERYDENIRWTGILAHELGPDFTVINEGYNGRTTVFPDYVEGRMSGIDYFGPCLDTVSPIDLLILMLGTNDLKIRFGASPNTIAFGFERYLHALETTPMAGNKPSVLLVSPILISDDYKNNSLFHDMFGEDAKSRSVGLANAYSEFASQKGWYFLDAAQYGNASAVDGVHMEPDSHERLGKAIAREIRKIIK